MAVLLGFDTTPTDLVSDGFESGAIVLVGGFNASEQIGYADGYADGYAAGSGLLARGTIFGRIFGVAADYDLGYIAARNLYIGTSYQLGLEDGAMLSVPQSTAKTVSVRTVNASTGLPEALTGGQLVTATVSLKKDGGAFAVVSRTLTLRDTFVDIALTSADTDTLGIAVLTFAVSGYLTATVHMDVVTTPALISAIKAKTDLLPTDPASQAAVIAAIPTANITAIKAKTDLLPADPASQAAVIAAMPSASAIRDAILDDLLANHSVTGSVADGVALACGLLQGNFYMDNVDNTDPNGQTSARLRLWRTAAAMSGVTPGGTGQGEFATFQVTTTYSGPNKIVTHKVVRQ